MAVYREPPKCPFCKKIIAKAIRKIQEPFEAPVYGDNFICWEYDKDHKCNEKNMFFKKQSSNIK